MIMCTITCIVIGVVVGVPNSNVIYNIESCDVVEYVFVVHDSERYLIIVMFGVI